MSAFAGWDRARIACFPSGRAAGGRHDAPFVARNRRGAEASTRTKNYRRRDEPANISIGVARLELDSCRGGQRKAFGTCAGGPGPACADVMSIENGSGVDSRRGGWSEAGVRSWTAKPFQIRRQHAGCRHFRSGDNHDDHFRTLPTPPVARTRPGCPVALLSDLGRPRGFSTTRWGGSSGEFGGRRASQQCWMAGGRDHWGSGAYTRRCFGGGSDSWRRIIYGRTDGHGR